MMFVCDISLKKIVIFIGSSQKEYGSCAKMVKQNKLRVMVVFVCVKYAI